MAGTKEGGKKAAKTNQEKYDAVYLKKYGMTFYQYQGAKGGRNGNTGGFAANRELARTAGAKGGRISRRTKQTAV